MIRAQVAILGVLLLARPLLAEPERRIVQPGENGRLAYFPEALGNRIPDFSHAGYGGGDPIPDVPIRVVVPQFKGDSGPRIQAALDAVARLAPDANGIRGAVLLLDGRYEVSGKLQMRVGGVVLRGSGKNTVLVASGTDRRALIEIRGEANRKLEEKSYRVAEKYVPVGAYSLRVDSTSGLKPGDTVLVEHPSTKEWIAAVGMDRFPSRDKGSYLDWRPGTVDIHWDRIITKVDGDKVTLDAPMSSCLDSALTQSVVRRYTWPGRVRKVGVENLRLESEFDRKNLCDEEHAWTGITVENAEDVWVRQVSFAHFAGSAVAVWESAKRVTICDCESREPVSELGGHRRHTFVTAGQQTLFLRCKSTGGRHDFAVAHLAAGPNVFTDCQATSANQYSGPIGSWASGVLYDNVTIDGAGLALTNRETDGQGVGWAAANSMLWQCSAPLITCRKPPTAQNWAIGVWGQFVGDGQWRQLNEFVKPQSLYAAQLNDRLGARALEVLERKPISTDPKDAEQMVEVPPTAHAETTSKNRLELRNGWLTTGGNLLTGSRQGTVWWRGSTLPSRAAELGAGITRFVPGRVGPGFTDNLDQLTDEMRTSGVAALDHHWGLWYDRRRDDHQMIRRIDGEVWAPFYEQPWARSGEGKAWDGLSKYDLTRFNPWYFSRLKQFAEQAEKKGLILVQQMYFQHNVLEAGAHWADFPWRPANCIQETGFCEPPEYVGGKRVFMAAAFYDVSNSVRRDLHRRYIRHCLDALGGCPNVLFEIGEEFTGPLSFVEFWLDTIADWQKEAGKKVLVGLCCTKDVQDSILADSRRGPLVSVIDLKYWWYTSNGDLYAPKGGENLAPRQQLREWKGNKSHTDASIARAVKEYRTKFPQKAVIVALEGSSGWAVVAAGGSIPRLPADMDARLRAAIVRMTPYESKVLPSGSNALADVGRDYLIWTMSGEPVRVDVPAAADSYAAGWVNLASGKVTVIDSALRGGQIVEIRPREKGPNVLYLTRN